MDPHAALDAAPMATAPPRGFWAKARALAGRLAMVEEAVAAWYCAADPQTPWRVRAALFGALTYFVAPIDLIPDVVAGFGYTDDAAVLAAVVGMVRSHMKPHHRTRAQAWLGRERGAAG